MKNRNVTLALATGVSVSSYLRLIKLSGNTIPDNRIDLILYAILNNNNNNIDHLWLESNNISSSSAFLFREIISKKSKL